MCELFGQSSSEKIEMNEALRAFFSNAREHPDGWGLAFFYGGSVSLEKQPECALDSAYLKQRLRAKIEADNMIAHIRLATKGTMDYVNTHPFVMRDSSRRAWTFEHNGTIFDTEILNHYVKSQKGQTDSERILMYLMDRMNRAISAAGRPLEPKERFDIIEAVTAEITPPNNKVNFLLYDGELLYAHANFKDSLYIRYDETSVRISTRILDHGNWEAVPLNTLLAFENGKLKFQGTDHGHEYFFSEEQMRLLFLDYAAL